MCPYFAGMKADEQALLLHNEKMVAYFKHLLGESKFYIGKTLLDSHKSLRLTEEDFDVYYRVFSKTLKTMKVNIRVVSAIMKLANSLRDQIVNQQPRGILEEIGELAGVQKFSNFVMCEFRRRTDIHYKYEKRDLDLIEIKIASKVMKALLNPAEAKPDHLDRIGSINSISSSSSVCLLMDHFDMIMEHVQEFCRQANLSGEHTTELTDAFTRNK